MHNLFTQDVKMLAHKNKNVALYGTQNVEILAHKKNNHVTNSQTAHIKDTRVHK